MTTHLIQPTSEVSTRRHDGLSIALHWSVALAVVLTYGFGLLREGLPRGPSRDFVLLLHMSFGILVMAGAVFRIAWHAGRSSLGARQPFSATWAAKLAHLALYAGLIAVPLAGLVMVWTKGQAVPFFGLVDMPQLLPTNRTVSKVLEEVHELMAHGLVALVGLHAAAALYPHYVLKDGFLAAMLPRVR
jgi:cytochrome b561